MPPKRFRNPDLASTPQRQCSPRATHLQRGPPQGEKSPDFLKRSIFSLKPSARIQRIGADFGYRFLWRPLLLAFFATLNAAFFPAGDVLLLFVVVGCVLFFCADCRFCGFPLLSLWKITFGKVAPAYACYFFYAIFSLGKLRFPRKKLGGIAAFAAFPCSPCGKSHFRKSCARFRVLLFLCNFSLRKTSISTEKIA